MKFVKYLFKTVKILLIIVMLAVFVSNFYVMLMSVRNPGSHPTVFGYSTAVVISGSMQPALNVEDLIVIKKQKEYNVQDIIAFSTGKSFVTHRIVEITDGRYITKGDANNTTDKQPVEYNDISGKVVFVIPHVGQITTFLKSPLGMFLIILIAFGAVVLPDKADKEEVEKDEKSLQEPKEK